MKMYYKIFLSLFSFWISFTSCVVSVPCTDAKLSLCFISFSESETTSLIVKWYRKDTDFKILVDTLLINRSNSMYTQSNDSLTIDYATGKYQGIKSGYDYKIILPLSNTTYEVKNIVELYEKRKVGFSSDPPTCSNPISSYIIDSRMIEGADNYESIYIHR